MTSAQVALLTVLRPWMTLMRCVLSPQVSSSSQVRPSRVLSAEKLMVVWPALPWVVLTVSHLGAAATVVSLPAIQRCWAKAHSPVALTVMSVEPPSWGMAT